MSGKPVVLITGGTSGIGLAAAVSFFKDGYRVAIMGRDTQRGQRAVAEIERQVGETGTSAVNSGDIIYFSGDVSHSLQCHEIADRTMEWSGRVDVLVNSAGIYFEKAIEDMTETDYIRMMDINLKGTYFMCQAVTDIMKKQGKGAIVNVGSDAGLHGNYMCSAYCASKGAVINLTRALALELAPWNIRVNCVCPGDIYTPMTEAQLEQFADREAGLREMSSVYPLNRIGTAKEVAAAITFLTSDKSAFTTGAILSVDGGITA